MSRKSREANRLLNQTQTARDTFVPEPTSAIGPIVVLNEPAESPLFGIDRTFSPPLIETYSREQIDAGEASIAPPSPCTTCHGRSFDGVKCLRCESSTAFRIVKVWTTDYVDYGTRKHMSCRLADGRPDDSAPVVQALEWHARGVMVRFDGFWFIIYHDMIKRLDLVPE